MSRLDSNVLEPSGDFHERPSSVLYATSTSGPGAAHAFSETAGRHRAEQPDSAVADDAQRALEGCANPLARLYCGRPAGLRITEGKQVSAQGSANPHPRIHSPEQVAADTQRRRAPRRRHDLAQLCMSAASSIRFHSANCPLALAMPVAGEASPKTEGPDPDPRARSQRIAHRRAVPRAPRRRSRQLR